MVQSICQDLGLKPRVFKEGKMGRKRFQPEQIICKMKESEVLLAEGDTVG